MLRHLGSDNGAQALEDAVEKTTGAEVRTPDLGASASTTEFGDEVLRALRRP